MALYHYTTQTRHDAILRSKTLNHSSDIQQDSTYGIGWYFTDLDPESCEKIRMHYCWQRGTLHQRVKYYFQLAVVGAIPQWKRKHVYFVPLNANVSFRIVSHGEVPECPLKPCHTCRFNPERT